MDQCDLDELNNTDLFYNNIPIGKKFPLFGICRNNISDSAVSSVGREGVRYATPPIAIKLWLENSHMVLERFIEKVKKINPLKVPYSSIGMKFFNDSLVTQKLSVDYLNIDDGLYEMLINNDTGKTAHKCWVKKDDRCSCHCPTFQMYRMMCTHLGKGLRHLKHFGYIGDLTTGAVSASVFPNFVLMKDIRASVLQIPILGYEFKDFIDTANVHARKTQLEPPPVYKLNPIKDTEHRIRSIGEVGFKNKTCKKNHFNLGNRFTFQSEKVCVKYYSDKTLTYFGGLMKAG